MRYPICYTRFTTQQPPTPRQTCDIDSGTTTQSWWFLTTVLKLPTWCSCLACITRFAQLPNSSYTIAGVSVLFWNMFEQNIYIIYIHNLLPLSITKFWARWTDAAIASRLKTAMKKSLRTQTTSEVWCFKGVNHQSDVAYFFMVTKHFHLVGFRAQALVNLIYK